MRRPSLAVMAALIVALSPGAGIAAPAPTAIAAPPAGFTEETDGTLVHTASGTRFPLAVEGFERFRGGALSKDGEDVFLSYRRDIGDQPVVARIALVHIEMMTPREHFVALRTLVGHYFQDLAFDGVTPIDDGPLSLPGLKPDSGWQGRFHAMHEGRPYDLTLSTIDLGYWSARLTAAYPTPVAAEAHDRIMALVAALRMTGPQPPAK